MSVAKKDYKRITTRTLIDMKENGEKLKKAVSVTYEEMGRRFPC